MQEDEHDMGICRKALRWIGLNDKTLNVRALCEALSIPNNEDTIEIEHLVDPDWISRSCSSLIRLSCHEHDQPHFRFAHFTVKEYLRNISPESKRSFFRSSNDEAVQDLFRISLRFLTFPIFDREPSIAASEIQHITERNEQHPFYPVAAGYMFGSRGQFREDTHLSLVLEDEVMMQYAKILFNPSKAGIFLSWVLEATWHWPDVDLSEERFFSIIGLILAPGFSPLHIAAMLSLPSLCAHLVENGRVDVNVCCRLGTPLHALLAGLHLMHSVDGFDYDSDLHYRNIHADSVPKYDLPGKCLKVLLENGADTSLRWNSTSVFEMTINNSIRTEHDKLWPLPLIISPTSVTEDDIELFAQDLVEEIIERPILDAIVALGSDPETAPEWARLASLIQTRQIRGENISEAAGSTNDIRTRILDEDFTDGVKLAISQGLTDFLASLLQDRRFKKDMSIPTRNLGLMPILHFAVDCPSLKSVELLLEAGCDPKAVHEDSGWTSLHLCAITDTGDAPITALLLKSGANDSVKDKMGNSCWHIAAEEGNLSVLKVLIDMGSGTKQSLATSTRAGRTPLASAIHGGQLDAAMILLGHCDAEMKYFRSDDQLLESAATIGSKDLFIQLLDKLKKAGGTETINSSKPLHNIGMRCSLEFADYLLSFWTTDGDSEALTRFLLHVNDDIYRDPNKYPSRDGISFLIRGLLPPGHVSGVPEKSKTHFWETFCQLVVPDFTNSCDHNKSQCRASLINMIFEILIDTRVLASYEQTTQLPGYKVLLQGFLNRDNLNCAWIAPSVRKVFEAHNITGNLANGVESIKLLSLAVRQTNFDLVCELLHRGVDVHAAHGSLSPIEVAFSTSSRPIFYEMLDHSKRSLIAKPGTRGRTLLHWLAAFHVPGHTEKIEQLLQVDAGMIDEITDDHNGDTALTLASFTSRQDIVQLLLSRGANALHRARDGWTLFHAAALTGDPGYIRTLDVSEVPMSFWLGACDFAFTGLADKPLMVKKTTAVHIAARNGNSHFLNYLCQKGIPFNVNAVTEWPFITPLHLASRFGHLEVVEILISREANVNVRDAIGLLPIEHAAQRSHLAVFKALLKSDSERPSRRFDYLVGALMAKDTERMADAESSKPFSQLRFENAITCGDLKLCQELVANGQSINEKLPRHSYTPLVRALVHRQQRIVDWLISSGVEVTNPVIESLHLSRRCIASLSAHYVSRTQTLSVIMDLALTQGVGWYGGILGPLHVAILDDNNSALETILSHIRQNETAYQYDYDHKNIWSLC